MYPSPGTSFPFFTLSNIRLLVQALTFIFWAPCLDRTQLQVPSICWEASLSIFRLIAQAPLSTLKAAKGKWQKKPWPHCAVLVSRTQLVPWAHVSRQELGLVLTGSVDNPGRPRARVFSPSLAVLTQASNRERQSLSPACLLNAPYTFPLNKRQQLCWEQDAWAQGCKTSDSSCIPIL